MESGTTSKVATTARPRLRAGPGLHVIYALSGATALLYEIVWTRLLALELGHTTASAGAVLAAFMGGLAIGALAAGRVTPRLAPATALGAYAILEIAIALFALAVPFEIAAVHPLLAWAYGDGPGGIAFQVLRLSTALLTIGLPAALMGATYPLVIVEGRAAGSLYAANTAGAALGAFSAGFILLPALGLSGSALVGVAGNLLVALVAWRLSAAWRGTNAETPAAVVEPAKRPQRSKATGTLTSMPAKPTVALVATAVSGYAALSLELAWTRTFAMVMGPTTYAFTTTVGCFIVGLALGSALAAWFVRTRGDKTRAEAWLAAALAIGTLAIGWAVTRVDDVVVAIAYRTAEPAIDYTRLLASEVLDAATLLIPMAVAFGAAFPLALAAARASSGREVGWAYAANTAGAIAGSLVTSAIAIPALGLHGSFLFGATLMGAMSVALAMRQFRHARGLAAVTAMTLVAAAGLLATTRWNVELLSSGAYKYSTYVGPQDLEIRLAAGTLNYYREGATGTVAVRDLAGVRSLSIDGKVDASNGGDMLTQRMLAHIPLLTHAEPRRVAIVGLGSGVTLGSALTYPVSRADVIEISPEVIEAAAWFPTENRHAMQDERVRLIRGDARTHFRLASSRYDVIVSEPSNPWMAGVAALFTREFFEALRSRLAEGGVVCQWAHTYDIAADDLRSIVATFAAVFPHVTLWLVGGGDLLLVGSQRPLVRQFAPERVSEAARRDLERAGVTSLAVLEHLKLGGGDLARRWAGTPRLQSDDRMALEFSVPSATVGASRDDNASALVRAARLAAPADAAVLRDVGLLALRAQAPERAWEYLSAAATRLPDDRAALDGLVRAAALSGDPSRLAAAEAVLRATAASRPHALASRLELARLLASRGDFEESRELAGDAERIAPRNPQVHEELAAIAADAGDAAGLERAVGRLRELQPRGEKTFYFEAVLRITGGHPDEALQFAREAVAADPQHAAAWNLLGSALGATGAPTDEIRNAFTRAIGADPSDPTAYANLGTLELSSGRASIAANWFAQALTVNPSHEAARSGLNAARSAAR